MFENGQSGYLKLFFEAIAHFSLNEETEAQDLLNEFIEKYGDVYPYGVAIIYAWRGEKDPAFEWLERAYQQRIELLVFILGNPWLQSLHSDPRFPAFLEKMGLLEYWNVERLE